MKEEGAWRVRDLYMFTIDCFSFLFNECRVLPFASDKRELSRCGQSFSRMTQNSLKALKPLAGRISMSLSTFSMEVVTDACSSVEMTLLFTMWTKIGSRSTWQSSFLCFCSSRVIRLADPVDIFFNQNDLVLLLWSQLEVWSEQTTSSLLPTLNKEIWHEITKKCIFKWPT